MSRPVDVAPVGRRQFLQTSAAIAALTAAGGVHSSRAADSKASPNEKLNIGIIGTANRAGGNIAGVQHENIVAICDIDENYLGKAAERFPQAQKHVDFRKLLEQSGIDAVVISTPDHIHAPATAAAIQLGKHVYVEKPLSHSVYEARVLADLANKHKVATQMGTQVHASNNYRRVVEVIRSGAIGPVREAHVWVGKEWGGGERPKETPPVPKTLHWDLWLGPAPERPYHSVYVPGNWRRWWDFGCGTLGDMGCHYLDLPFWALDLKYPTTVSAEGPPVHAETAPKWMIARYNFPARGEQPACKLTWYDGGKRPELFEQGKLPKWGDGVLFIGDKGMMLADYGRYVLLPENDFKEFKAPEKSIPDSIGHYHEWLKSCRDGSPTTCNFNYSGALTETVHLGNVAYRVGQEIAWDSQKLVATNCSAAEHYIKREYRKGWKLV